MCCLTSNLAAKHSGAGCQLHWIMKATKLEKASAEGHQKFADAGNVAKTLTPKCKKQ